MADVTGVSVAVMEETKALLLKHGWTQGEFYEADGDWPDADTAMGWLAEGRPVQMCIIGAEMIAAASYAQIHTVEWEGVCDRASYWLQRALPEDFESIWEAEYTPNVLSNFNDSPGRELDEVIALIDRAIHLASAKDRVKA